jgi:hypothetical protein
VVKRFALLLIVCAAGSPPLHAAELKSATSAAFDRYVRVTEARMAAPEPFLWIDGLPEAERRAALEKLRGGDFVIESMTTKEGGRTIEIPDGMVHHWLGVVFVRDASLAQAVALLQDYDRHAQIYKPNVARSKLVSRSGDDFKLFLRFHMKKVITVVVNSDHEAHFTRVAPDRVSSRIRSTRIAEVEDPDTPRERELPVGHDSGYLWRLNSYWRFLQRPEGVYIQCESITLTRGVPYGFGWLVTSIPRETLEFTLATTQKALAARAATTYAK